MGSCTSRNHNKSCIEIHEMLRKKENQIEQMKNLVLLNKVRNCPKLSISDSSLYSRRKLKYLKKTLAFCKTRQSSPVLTRNLM